MRSCRNHRTFFAWLAMCTFVLGALASAVMPLVRGVGSEAWVEVCTLAGSKWLSADAASVDLPSHVPGQNGPAGHCPWCSSQTPALELSGHAQVSPLPRLTGPVVGIQDAAPPLQARAWALAPSRAPPFAS